MSSVLKSAPPCSSKTSIAASLRVGARALRQRPPPARAGRQRRPRLDELAALVSALRTELMVVKLSGSSGESVDGIVGDLWANIEGLRQVTGDVTAPYLPQTENLA